ncbi:MAG: hypothetical protein ACREX3_03090 [Gammaproteobacteria bacterium]
MSQQTASTSRTRAYLLLLAGSVVACTQRTEKSVREPQGVPAAEDVMRVYLEYARLPGTTPVPDSLQECEAYGGGDPQLALAKYRIVSSDLRNDTSTVRAEVTSVATVRLASDGPYEVRQQIKIDTLSWSLVRRPDTGGWAVCGYSHEGVGFVRLQSLGSTARWLEGTSLASVMRLGDSIARAP